MELKAIHTNPSAVKRFFNPLISRALSRYLSHSPILNHKHFHSKESIILLRLSQSLEQNLWLILMHDVIKKRMNKKH